MNDDTALKAREVFLDALELDAEEREGFIRRAAGQDADVLARAVELLAAHDGSARFFDGLEQGALRATPEAAELQSGASVGVYRIVSTLGSGGFGRVYLAEQSEPVGRRVALKVMRTGLHSDTASLRFAAERQALARMEHPGIARVFDAGTTPEGLPYFAMEYVPGVSLTDYCDDRKLGLNERLELFEGVCQAVAHAHERGVLHRDIKPSNVLVVDLDGKPQVKVIDFGIAKAIDRPLIEQELESVAGDLMGTPAYMSPEQAAGKLDLDSRADVYSLGALLYELLAGVPPFDARQLGLARLLQAILDDEPPRPSRQESFHGEFARSVRIPADLDWVAMRCLEKDRAQRYASASALGIEVRRFLEGHPVEAAPPSTWYRAQKLVRRHRWLTVAALIACLAIGVGAGGVWVGLLRARQERDVAQAILEFLRSDLLTVATPTLVEGRGKDVTLLEVIDVAAKRLEDGVAAKDLTRQPRVLAAIQATLAELYSALGELSRSRGLMDAALAAYDDAGLADSPEALRGASFQVATLLALGELDSSVALGRDTLNAQKRLPASSGDDAIRTRARLAFAVNASGDSAGAVALAEQVMRDVERSPTAGPSLRLMAHNLLAIVCAADQQLERAEEQFRIELAMEEQYSGSAAVDSLVARGNLAANLQAQGRLGEATEILLEILGPMRKALGAGHPRVLDFGRNLGLALVEQGRLDEGRSELEDVLRLAIEHLGPRHIDTAAANTALGLCLEALGDERGAEELLRRGLEDAQSAVGPDAHETHLARQGLLSLLFDGERLDGEFFALAEEHLASRVRALGSGHLATLRAQANLGLYLREVGRLQESESIYLSALETSRSSIGRAHPETLATQGALVELLRESGRLTEAEALGRDALYALESTSDPNGVMAAKAQARLSFVLFDGGRREEARELLEPAHEVLVDSLGPTNAWVLYARELLDEVADE